ncbi:MAG: BlaI/MecI/CopY family transcriptional regulator [Ruminococcaceae bacterium]|nr:BlaI/MecI/CopY family transcriptional regulator [Oscillospiraceae bacterium]
MKTHRIPDSELDVMLVLWQSETPLRVIDIHNGLRGVRPCSKPAIHTLLDRLAEKGFVKIETVEAAIPYKLISPIVTEEEYRREESDNFITKLCRGSLSTLIATLIDTGKITDDDIDEIARLLDEKKKK